MMLYKWAQLLPNIYVMLLKGLSAFEDEQQQHLKNVVAYLFAKR